MRIIKNTVPLDSSYVPDNLIFREREISIISDIVISSLTKGIATPLWVYGAPGVGKTSTLKYLQRKIKNPRILYENSLSHGSVRAILISILAQLGKVVPPAGVTYKQIFTAFNDYHRENNQSLVVVLDEAAHLYKDTEGIYNLNRAQELYNVSISPVFISIDTPEIHSSFREQAGSIRLETLRFGKYSTDELFGIILDRAKRALNDGTWNEEILRYVAESSEEYGSARVAIETLQKAALLADHRGAESIEPDDVRSAISIIDPYVTESKLLQLGNTDLIILLAICRVLRGSISTNVKEISIEVQSVMEEFPIRGADFRIYDTIRKLERLGFVKGIIVGMGDRKGVSKVIQISDIPVGVLSRKIENILSVIGR